MYTYTNYEAALIVLCCVSNCNVAAGARFCHLRCAADPGLRRPARLIAR